MERDPGDVRGSLWGSRERFPEKQAQDKAELEPEPLTPKP